MHWISISNAICKCIKIYINSLCCCCCITLSLPHEIHVDQPRETTVSTSNKMLNLFSNFLHRHHNHNNSAKSEANSNYLNIKNLKRATSSTNFGGGGSIKTKVSSPPTFGEASSINKLLFNPATLFSMNNSSSSSKQHNSSKQTQPPVSHQSQQAQLPPNFSFVKANNKYRRSYDDVSKLSILISSDSAMPEPPPQQSQQQQQLSKKQKNVISPTCSTKFSFSNKKSSKSQLVQPTTAATPALSTSNSIGGGVSSTVAENTENIFIDLSNNSKFENTAFSTKNNGLIFLPSPTKCRTPSPPEILPPPPPPLSQQQQTVPPSYNDNYEIIENLNNNSSNINYDCLLPNESSDLTG